VRVDAIGGGGVVRADGAEPGADDVLGRLEGMIVGGRFAPGERVREQELAQALGVSRGPLREAIRVLEGRRLLERTPNAGVRVADPSIEDLEQMLVVREALEGIAAREAAQRITVAELRALGALTARIARLDGKGAAGLAAMAQQGGDADFHRSVVLASGNRWLEQLLCRDLYSLIRLFRFRAAALRSDPGRTHAEHRAIVERLEERDAGGAERAMRAHVRGSRERLIAFLRGARGADR
jgi:DNA-binding GntR family transcriptional regulator